jgi:hypothetical protein
MSSGKHRAWYQLPFVALWYLATAVERRLGIVVTLAGGLTLMLLGLLFCLTFVGILIGIPTIVLGLFLVLRAMY